MSRHAAPRGRRPRRAGAAPPTPPITPTAPAPPPAAPPGPAPPAAASPASPAHPGPELPTPRTGPAHGPDRLDGARPAGSAVPGGPPEPALRPADPAAARRLHLLTALAAAVLTAGLAAAAAYGRTGVLVGVAAVQALLVPAYVLGTRMPGRVGGLLLGLAAAGAADTALLVNDRTSLAALLGVLALAFPVMLLHQLARGVVRVAATASLAAVALLVAAQAGLSCCLALARAVDGPRLVAALVLGAGAGLVVARLVDAAVPAPRLADDVAHGLLAVLAATAAGAAAGALAASGAAQLTAAGGALLGAVVAALAALVAVGVGFVAATADPGRRPVDRLLLAYQAFLGAGLPVALAAPVGYLVALSVAG